MLKFKLGQFYDNRLLRKEPQKEDVPMMHQRQDQESGIEQHNAAIKEAKKVIAKREIDRLNRISGNLRMAEIISAAKQNVAEGKIIKVGA